MKRYQSMFALFGAVMLCAGLVGWTLHVPQGPAANSMIYAEDSNYLKDLAPGTSGQCLKTNGTGSAPSWVDCVTGAAGLKVVGLSVTLDGTNPSSVAHGLTAVTACSEMNLRSTAPGDEVTAFTYVVNGANIDLYAWTTNGTDPTLIASTDANDVVKLICVGT